MNGHYARRKSLAWQITAASLLICLWGSPLWGQGEEEHAGPQLNAGLVATYQSIVDPTASVQRIDAKPAFLVTEGSVHPRLPAGPFQAAWRGTMVWNESEPVTFSALVGGEISVKIDGELVLKGQSNGGSQRITSLRSFQRQPGTYAIDIQFRSLQQHTPRLQIWWEGAEFSAEPLAAWHLQHAPDQVPAEYAREQLVDAGRELAGEFGCARCHTGSFPAVKQPPPGPLLTRLHERTSRRWLLAWLADPAALRSGAHMPSLFANDRSAFLERWAITDYLLSKDVASDTPPAAAQLSGDHRMGRRLFISNGCATCHYLPEVPVAEQLQLGQQAFQHLADRWTLATLAEFFRDVHNRYVDHRMPQLPLTDQQSRDIAAYLLLWSTVNEQLPGEPAAPMEDELTALVDDLKAASIVDAGRLLFEQRGCAVCHSAAESVSAVALRASGGQHGCLDADRQAPHVPRFQLDDQQRGALSAYLTVALAEQHAAPFFDRQQQLKRAQCTRCHQRDTDQSPAIERIASTLGGAWLQRIPYQRTPRLSFALQKYEHSHLLQTVRAGIQGLHDPDYTFQMPSFGNSAEALVLALAEADGDILELGPPSTAVAADPTIGSLFGPDLVGFQGYSCVGCHVWSGQLLADPDPAAIAPDLLRTVGRIQRPWFDRLLENPLRLHPGIPMPAIFPRGRPVLLDNVFNGNADAQRDALWNYFALGPAAPSPKAAPALPVPAPVTGQRPLVAQIPLQLETGAVESLSLLFDSHDLVVFDLGSGLIARIYVGAELQRTVAGRIRKYLPAAAQPPLLLDHDQERKQLAFRDAHGVIHYPDRFELHHYEYQQNIPTVSATLHYGATGIQVRETFRIPASDVNRELRWRIEFANVPTGWRPLVEFSDNSQTSEQVISLPPASQPQRMVRAPVLDAGRPPSILDRPGYRAVEFAIPRSAAGEDLVMPSALAITPLDKRVFVASMKLGELLELTDPLGDGTESELRDYATGLFQEAYSMTADEQAVYVLHRRNLTAVRDTDGDGSADRFERIYALPHSIADSYDYAYGLARDRSGGFVFSYAPYASRTLPGSGGAVRLDPATNTKTIEQLAYGMRNPLGWCAGPDQEIFFTDNQGEWVATNKLCHIMPGHYYGFPNPEQAAHGERSHGRTAVWVPYAWAHSINGVTFDNTQGKFGPFAGQFFLAELMFGGAIIRANVEQVNGQYQGACFPFWSSGLLGPVTLAFHPDGPLFVGGITEPGWMAQPDRGGLYRIDYTGELPFEMQSIQILPQGFRIRFTRAVDPASAAAAENYSLEHYRYEYTSAYGSPELDRTPVSLHRIEVAADGLSVSLTTDALMADRVYMIAARAIRSVSGEPLVHDTGAYTVNEIPQ